jgi:hypothetical protein
MKSQEKQSELNVKLLKSSERIEEKLDKESDSSRTRSHHTSEGRRLRSIGRHHHHSQDRSKRRAHSSSSPYPTRKHRRSGVDEIKGEMNKIKPPTSDGEHKREEDAKIFPIALSCRRKNYNISTERKSIHVVGSTYAGATN